MVEEKERGEVEKKRQKERERESRRDEIDERIKGEKER